MLTPDYLFGLAEPLTDIALSAGRDIMSLYRDKDKQARQSKSDNSPVTAADLAAHHIIVKGLSQLTPDYPIISEENTERFELSQLADTPYWLVDPLDGTREFIHETDQFSVNIALIVKAMPVLGLIYLPAIQDCYFACATAGCFKLIADQYQSINTRPWPINNPCVVTISRRHGVDALSEFLETLPDFIEHRAGSAYKFCLLAEGTVDLYPRFAPTMSWDTAAGQCLLEEAGGKMMTLTGQPLRYHDPYQKNGFFHAIGDPRALDRIFR